MKKKINYYTYTFDMKWLNILAIVLFLLISIPIYWLEKNQSFIIHLDIIELFIAMFFYLILHELFHGIGFLLIKDINLGNITWGIALEKGVFYCMCKKNIHKKDILLALSLPVVFLGGVTLLIGLMIHSYELTFLSILNITSSIGDIMMMIYFFKCPSDIIYLDLDDATSFTVISFDDLSKIKVLGIALKEKGIYTSKMKSHDRRNLVISKPSYFLIGFILFLIVLKIVGGIM